ncbi:type II toxin-antitoxin system RelE/ParE family toxin [Asticcacaulis sp. YBE204]|uniref:type II toxin-antitoxin system RelE/ParE family toxin n=1 Tax=Asticcacaulis sp. YBE204 TaxID=1282363 RepID=UPI0003C3BC5B|nr:type II toxin-antitoxin system RelE/ParE family toxin [Asticcacaulis sp. YBE204]ESQ80079.1 hypothetical protein AEYBE204_05530 [Asticcacaulis sp. YBE204]
MSLADSPHRGAVRGGLSARTRILPYGYYNIYYRVGDDVEILRILHSARHIDDGDL